MNATFLEDNVPTIYWTPEENGEASWQTTPDHSDGFEKDDILVTPIHSDSDASVTVTPAPEEKDWRDAILVFPESSGIAPLYVVYNESNINHQYIPTPQGNPPLPAFPEARKAKEKHMYKVEERKDRDGKIKSGSMSGIHSMARLRCMIRAASI